MMTRICDCCARRIEQPEFLEITVRALDPEAAIDQDESAEEHGDFCDRCIASGGAVTQLLKRIGWTLEPRPGKDDQQ